MKAHKKLAHFNPGSLRGFRRETPISAMHDESFYRYAVEIAADEVFLMDKDSRIIYANRSACEQLGYEYGDLVGKCVWEWDPSFSPDIWPGFWKEMVSSRRIYFETRHRKKNGSSFPVEIHAHIYEAKNDVFIIAFVNDITEKKAAERAVYEQANYDSLTHLANRYQLQDRLFHALAMAKRDSRNIAVLFLDLNKFKAVNDTYGHHAGDQVLKETAQRLARNIREVDTVARLGGDEFVIVLENIDNLRLEAIAIKLTDAIEEPITWQDSQLTISASIGIALFPEHADNADDLLQKADMAMYAAKQQGLPYYTFIRNSPAD